MPTTNEILSQDIINGLRRRNKELERKLTSVEELALFYKLDDGTTVIPTARLTTVLNKDR